MVFLWRILSQYIIKHPLDAGLLVYEIGKSIYGRFTTKKGK